jgi:hypothetical protein
LPCRRASRHASAASPLRRDAPAAALAWMLEMRWRRFAQVCGAGRGGRDALDGLSGGRRENRRPSHRCAHLVALPHTVCRPPHTDAESE